MRLRLRRLAKAFGLRKARPNDSWAARWLRQSEREVFALLDPRDREHAIKVAQQLYQLYPQAPTYVMRAALLHDIGKLVRPYRAAERFWATLLRFPVNSQPISKGFWGALQVRRHHPFYAQFFVQDPQVLDLVREHHQPKSLWGKRLHAVDRAY